MVFTLETNATNVSSIHHRIWGSRWLAVAKPIGCIDWRLPSTNIADGGFPHLMVWLCKAKYIVFLSKSTLRWSLKYIVYLGISTSWFSCRETLTGASPPTALSHIVEPLEAPFWTDVTRSSLLWGGSVIDTARFRAREEVLQRSTVVTSLLDVFFSTRGWGDNSTKNPNVKPIIPTTQGQDLIRDYGLQTRLRTRLETGKTWTRDYGLRTRDWRLMIGK